MVAKTTDKQGFPKAEVLGLHLVLPSASLRFLLACRSPAFAPPLQSAKETMGKVEPAEATEHPVRATAKKPREECSRTMQAPCIQGRWV